MPQAVSLEFRKKFFFLSLCLLFASEGFDLFSYALLGITALSAIYCLHREGIFRRWKELPYQIYLPVLLAVYTAVSPGQWFKDLPIGDKMLASFLSGFCAVCILPASYHLSLFGLPVAIAVSFLICAIAGFSEGFYGDTRLILFSGNPNKLAFIAGAGVLICLIYSRLLKGRQRNLAVFAGGINMIVLLLTSSRTAFGATFLCLFYIGLTFLRRHFVKMLVGLLISVLFIFVFLPEKEKDRFAEILGKPLQDVTLQRRMAIWETAVAGIKNSPWFGISLRGFRSFYADYTTGHQAEFEKKYGEFKEDPSHPHNLVIGLVLMYGFIGLPIFFLAFIPALRYAFSENEYFFLSMVLFQFLNGVFDFNLHRVAGALLLFFPLGIVYGNMARRVLLSKYEDCSSQS